MHRSPSFLKLLLAVPLAALTLSACYHTPPPYMAAPPPAAAAPQAFAPPTLARTPQVETERYQDLEPNPVQRVAEAPISTFSIDVDTGAYANVRRFLNEGRLPYQNAVRVEEMINYFDYAYPQPGDEHPFSVNAEVGPTPWSPKTRLLRIGIQGRRVTHAKMPPANLVLLVDVSGSMNSPDKLPLLQSGLGLLVKELRPEDRVSLVTYSGNVQVLLSGVPGDQRARIERAISQLRAAGATAGGAALDMAYLAAREHFMQEGVNRILLATDGDFNLGVVNQNALEDKVEQERRDGIALTTLGFGTDNYNEHLMERLADLGNGNYAYIDSMREAHKVLVREMGSTLHTIAKDVKIQLEFNPAVVSEYRLIGYENRLLKAEDFANDKVDAGEIGAGHSVTALYEIALVGEGGERLPERRYGPAPDAATAKADELGFLKLRYQPPAGGQSILLERPLPRSAVKSALTDTSDDFRFAAAVAAFGQQLRKGEYLGEFGYPQIIELAGAARGADTEGDRAEFIGLVKLAQSLDRRP